MRRSAFDTVQRRSERAALPDGIVPWAWLPASGSIQSRPTIKPVLVITPVVGHGIGSAKTLTTESANQARRKRRIFCIRRITQSILTKKLKKSKKMIYLAKKHLFHMMCRIFQYSLNFSLCRFFLLFLQHSSLLLYDFRQNEMDSPSSLDQVTSESSNDVVVKKSSIMQQLSWLFHLSLFHWYHTSSHKTRKNTCCFFVFFLWTSPPLHIFAKISSARVE